MIFRSMFVFDKVSCCLPTEASAKAGVAPPPPFDTPDRVIPSDFAKQNRIEGRSGYSRLRRGFGGQAG